jgi:hypothetical protein
MNGFLTNRRDQFGYDVIGIAETRSKLELHSSKRTPSSLGKFLSIHDI